MGDQYHVLLLQAIINGLNEIAESLKEALETNEIVEEVNSTAGYLNFKSSRKWLAKHVIGGNIRIGNAEVNSANEAKSVLIEHTSANLNKPFHVGRARNAILGDTLVRLNRLHGNNVRSEYYVDDMGKQVAVLAWALANLSAEEVENILSDREPVSEIWEPNLTMREPDGIKPRRFCGMMNLSKMISRRLLVKWFTLVKWVIAES